MIQPLNKTGYTFLLICLCQMTSDLFAQGYNDSLDLRLSQLLRQRELPGFAAVIVDKDGIRYRNGFGYADIKKQEPFACSTIENIGSVSKTFIAVALMKAIELGYFSLETNINAVLPFTVVNPFFKDEPIKLKHLITHTSGIIDNDSIYNRSYRFDQTARVDKAVAEIMVKYGYTGGIRDTTLKSFMYSYLSPQGNLYGENNFLKSRPGQRSRYSNIASALAAYMIEAKAGISFADFTEKHILQPLKMDQTTWFLKDADKAQHAVPYFNKAMAFPFYSLITYPDGGLRTSADDLSKYVIEMIRGRCGKSTLLSRESFDIMFAPRFTPRNLPEGMNLDSRNKGVFWNLYKDGNIGHDGSDPGISTSIVFNQEWGIIFMTNMYLEDRSPFLKVLQEYAGELVE